MMFTWRLAATLSLAAAAAVTEPLVDRAAETVLTGYEYVVVGSGAGGGPVAARLALAGHKTLLIEAGDDQGATNINYTVPAYQAKSTEDPLMDWDFFVRHFPNDKREKLDPKLSYNLPGGGIYTGLNPPAGATIKGVLYPRSATLGGCTAHNALVSIYPDRDDWQHIADLTGDQSWAPDNMRNYFVKMENNGYTFPGTPGHGYSGWFYDQLAPIQLALEDTMLLGMLIGAAKALGFFSNIFSVLAGDINADTRTRDSTTALYQIPIATHNGARDGSREFILSVANARNFDGSKKYPLDIRLNCFVTKVTFDQSTTPPKATGVQFLDGKSLYRADPRSSTAPKGKPGSVTVSREVIVAGGAYNSPQILKLSGIGPAAELKKFGIPVIKNSPGVGSNMQDHYEIVVQGAAPQNFTVLDNCTFGYTLPDPCLEQWKANPYGFRGTYSSSGFAGAILYKSSASVDGNYDIFEFGGPVNFRGYFPGYAYQATKRHNVWSWAILKGHPRNNAGTVTLKSANPLDTPEIVFRYFDSGSGDYNVDYTALSEAIDLARAAFSNQSVPFTEILPGAQVQTEAQKRAYIDRIAWGHHCSCTCAIGADNDPRAVLDSSFRVRGVTGLRVVDASVYPRIPGTFPAVSTYMLGEKAADVILQQLYS